MNLYTGQFVDDVDGDGVPDVVNIHGGDPFAQPGQFLSSPQSWTGVHGLALGRLGSIVTCVGVRGSPWMIQNVTLNLLNCWFCSYSSLRVHYAYSGNQNFIKYKFSMFLPYFLLKLNISE